jgi:hypothetical protein
MSSIFLKACSNILGIPFLRVSLQDKRLLAKDGAVRLSQQCRDNSPGLTCVIIKPVALKGYAGGCLGCSLPQKVISIYAVGFVSLQVNSFAPKPSMNGQPTRPEV